MRQTLRMIAGAIALLSTLAACAPNRQELSGSTDGKAPIGKNLSVMLPPPADFGRPVEASQVLTMTGYGRTFALETRLSITRKNVSLVALDTMGRRAMTISWDGAKLAYEKADWVPSLIDPGAVLADVYLLYGQEKTLSERLAPLGCIVMDDKQSREITCGGKPLLSAQFGWQRSGRWNGNMHYGNRSWGYDVEVQSSDMKR